MLTLRLGDSGPQVELLQLGLSRAGYIYTPPDGLFGPITQRAVINFQKSLGLSPDGIAGIRTWSALMPYLTGFTTVTVKNGESLFKLAQRYGSSLRVIETANPSVDPFNLQVGSQLIIPLPFQVVPTNISFTSTVLELCVRGLKARYPFLETGNIGTSVLGRPLYYLRIGSGQNEVFYNASHHANEWITSPLLMTYFEDYATAYAFDATIFNERATELYNEASLYIVPMVNPDGVDLVTGEIPPGSENYNKALRMNNPPVDFPSGWKANINGVDLNLQYPAGWEEARRIKFAQGYTSPGPRDYVGSAPLSQPESRAVYNFTLNHNFRLTLSYHTQGRVIYWKYLNYEPAGSYQIAQVLGRLSGYAVEETPAYSAFAGYKDWFILYYNRPGYTIEVGLGASPVPLSQFDEIYAENVGVLTYSQTAAG